MNINTRRIQQLVIATAFTSSLASLGIAASAQTTAAPVAAPSTTTVSMSTVSSKAQRQAELAQENAEARRIVFRYAGTSE